jgi:hypothetical protein
MTTPSKIRELEEELDDFDPLVRAEALSELVASADAGLVQLEQPGPAANMHCHTFFSFNAYGYSPSHLAWLARQRGLSLMGIVDFDVVDGVDEFLSACNLAGVRASAGIETRVFIPEFATREINSPGEPGVYYHMGIGFTTSRVSARGTQILSELRERAARRNKLVLERINRYLAPVCIDYEADVLPLTPAGNATERHMILAYLHTVERSIANRARFWADKLDLSLNQASSLLQDSPKFQNFARAKLMKRGGVGYIQPDSQTFPSIQEVNELVLDCQALPCATWLDGSSQGEQDIAELMELLTRQGIVALNIIPDRNWNIADPEIRTQKVQNLYDIVKMAGELDLPLNIGTEMNSFGQKLVDDFNATELAPLRQAFLDGAYFIYGHTVLQRALGLGYQSDWTADCLPGRRERNTFYTDVGYRVKPGRPGLAQLKNIALLKNLNQGLSPEDILSNL